MHLRFEQILLIYFATYEITEIMLYAAEYLSRLRDTPCIERNNVLREDYGSN